LSWFLRPFPAVPKGNGRSGKLVAVGEEKDGTYQSGSPVSFKAALKVIEADERVLYDPEDSP
jgi:hypothetical protein